MQNLLLKAAKKGDFSNVFDKIVEYGNDFNPSPLEVHLEMLGSALQEHQCCLSFYDVKDIMKNMSPGVQLSMCEAFTLQRLVLTATNAVSNEVHQV